MAKKRYDKLTVRQLKQGAKYMALGFALEAAILAPSKDVKIGNKEFTVGGIFTTTQSELASIALKVLNIALPTAAKQVDSLLKKTDVQNIVRDRIVGFLYDDLAAYSVNALISKAFNSSGFLEKNRLTAAFRTYLSGVLENNDNRENLIKGITDSVISAVNVLTDGTLLSLLFGDAATESAAAYVSGIVEKALLTEAGDETIEKILSVIADLDIITVPFVLESFFRLPKEEMIRLFDEKFSYYLGEGLVERAEQRKLGDEVGGIIDGIEYNEFFDKLIEDHLYDLLKVGLTAAGIGISILDHQDKVAKRKMKRK